MFLIDKVEYKALVIGGWVFHIVLLLYLKGHTTELENLEKEQ